ncbi:MAG: hypothetical protein JF627_05675 [Alphaproteobacteria bacterium]|nr:hypothetical protein [Alphaproteobacteria bacterium]
MAFGFSPRTVRGAVWGLWGIAAVLVVAITWRLLFMAPQDGGQETFPSLQSSDVVKAPTGHAYRYVVAPNITWAAAKNAAAKYVFEGHNGYLATIGDKAEFDFIMAKVFPNADDTDTTYLGGRQTTPGEWRWVTGPEGAADGGKGTLFWTGYENGHAEGGHFSVWNFSAFQHGGKWDVHQVCCVTLFSYRRRLFSTSLGNGDPEEGVAGYLVEFSG